MTFKNWLLSELQSAVDSGIAASGSMNPTRDKEVLNQTVQQTFQSPAIAPIVSKVANNNGPAAFGSALKIAQKTIKANQHKMAGVNPLSVNALDVAKGVLGQIGEPGAGLGKSAQRML